MGKIAKQILARVNKNLREITKLQQWPSTNDVIKWFEKSHNPNLRQSFIIFDVVTFYPNISEKLLSDSFIWAKNIVNISDSETEIIMQACEHLLYAEGIPWKKRTEKTFMCL